MPKKKFEDTPYDPIAADLVRDVVASRNQSTARTLALATSLSIDSPPSRPAMGLVPPVETAQLEASSPDPEPTFTKRFLLNRGENEDLNAFLLRVQRNAGTKVTLSMFTRALFNVAMQAEAALLSEVNQGRPRRFPSTHDSIAQGIFEDWWMRCLTNALRTLPRAGT